MGQSEAQVTDDKGLELSVSGGTELLACGLSATSKSRVFYWTLSPVSLPSPDVGDEAESFYPLVRRVVFW